MGLVTEWIEKKEHYELNELQTLIKYLIQTVEQEHTKGNYLTNLSLQSIEVDERDLQVKLIDNTNYNTDTYTAPELFILDERPEIAPEQDVYSIGAILYEIVFGTSLWDAEELDEETFKQFIEGKTYTFDENDEDLFDGEPFVVQFLKATLTVNPQERLTLSELYQLCDVTQKEIVNESSVTQKEIVESNLEDVEDAELEIVEGREIGIDLGTTNSVVSYVENGKIHTLEFKNGSSEPSAIFFDSPQKKVFGKKAYDKGIDNPRSCVRLFKRKLKDKKDVFQIEFYKKESQNSAQQQSKTYIIDTNVFIDEPFILNEVNSVNKVVLSKTVIEELSYIRDNKQSISLQANKAIDEIQKAIQSGKVGLEDSDISLLPEDLFVSNASNNDVNDNKILSIALKLKQETPVLITSDKALQLKAESALSEPVLYETLSDFKLDQPIKSAKSSDILRLTGEEATALFLRHLRETASNKIGYVSRAVITVPANFNNVEIEATKNAGYEAGFTDIQIQREPVAAAFAYGIEEKEDQKLLVYDFGGGTFDVSIIDIDGKGKMEVLATGGDSSLGGEDITDLVVEWIYEQLEDKFDLEMYDESDCELSSQEYQVTKKEVYKQAEKVKKELSEVFVTEVQLLNIYTAPGEMQSVEFDFSRNDFNLIIRSILAKASKTMIDTIANAGITIEEIDTVILAGGTSAIPAIHESVEKQFGKKPKYTKNTATVISQGAALFASSEWNEEDEERIIDKPIVIENTLTSFGVALKNHKYDEIIEPNAALPLRATKEYALVKDYQENLRIDVYTRQANAANVTRTVDEGVDFLDNIYIQGLPKLKQSEAKIVVTFEINKEYILNVSAIVCDHLGNELKADTLEVSKASRTK